MGKPVELSRAAFLHRSGVALAGLAGVSALEVARASAASGEPKPIPGGFAADFSSVPKNPALHVFQPLKGGELSSIGDFNGFVAATEIQGNARGSDGSKYSYDCDMRFMQGSYVATDGRLVDGTFGFI